jgi:tetraacyldisaccharide 4'-kinase
MSESVTLKLRKVLDQSLKKKSLIIKFFLPILFLISYLVSKIAKMRRNESYSLSTHPNIKIICVGNIIIGGSGKSPIVQHIATEFLKKGHTVAIASRGMTDKNINRKCVYYSNSSSIETLNFLSDENREHYELLRQKNLLQNLYILQNKNRFQALKYFSSEVSQKRNSTENIFILDDGLQHFACPRDINICVWQPELLRYSPPFAMPVGPYREGFGLSDFNKLLVAFDIRIWSRTKQNNIHSFMQLVKSSLSKYQEELSHKDIICSYSLDIFKVYLTNSNFVFEKVKLGEHENVTNAGVLAGIANPQKFIEDIKENFENLNNINYLLLSDHANFTKNKNKIINFLNENKNIIITFKDFCRWINEPLIRKYVSENNFFCCTISCNFFDFNFTPRLLPEEFDIRRE